MANSASTTRRSLLKALPAAPAALTLPAAAQAASPYSEVQRMFRDWFDMESYLNSRRSRHLSEESLDALCIENCDREDAMLEHPSTSLADLAAKVVAATTFGDFNLNDQVIFEAARILDEAGFAGTLARARDPRLLVNG